MVEIERKFLVNSDSYKNEAFEKFRIMQGFLNTHPERTVRIRIKGKEAFITVKGKSNESGLSRYEWEKSIPVDEAEQLLNLCEPGIIEKTRYLIKHKGWIYEVDEFFGENEGLVIAEIELKNENDSFPKPHWLGQEVTGDLRYYNSLLCQKPYLTW